MIEVKDESLIYTTRHGEYIPYRTMDGRIFIEFDDTQGFFGMIDAEELFKLHEQVNYIHLTVHGGPFTLYSRRLMKLCQ